MYKNNLVSVIIPTYNIQYFLDSTLESIVNQTYKNLEIILIDDCSNDGTYQKIIKWADKDSRIVYRQLEKNSGAAVSRNVAIGLSNGRFLAFCDSDDLWQPDKIEKQISFMRERDIAFCFTQYVLQREDGKSKIVYVHNKLGFRPGLVGGHCIGVDPYYFTYESEKLGYHSQIILSGRKVNDSMGQFVANAAIKEMIKAGKAPKESKVVILGLTFKENCPDIRNSKVEDIVNRLKEFDIVPVISDTWANKEEVKKVYNIDLVNFEDIKDADCLIIAVAHEQYKKLLIADFDKLFINEDNNQKIIIDVKGILNRSDVNNLGYHYWRL